MALDQDEYKFPDEEDELEIEIDDDTPEVDRGREPMPRSIVEELEADELDSYDAKTKEKLKQMRKVWHDERREKEKVQREASEAITLAQRLFEENKRINSVIQSSEKEYVTTIQHSANTEYEQAKRAYKDAYEQGDSDGLVEAQERMNMANIKVIRAHNMQTGTLQTPENDVQLVQQHLNSKQQATVQPDQRALAWREQNPWFNDDNAELKGYALGLHAKLLQEGYTGGSEEYYAALDKRMSKVLPQKQRKSSSVVASASRSTTPNKVRLTQSQVAIAKKFGLTPEQYAKEVIKLEQR
jgi:cellobiose-specific phosphotransferase system component IIA